jgi:hypothetical protein
MDMGEDLARSLAAGAATTPEEMEERGWPIEEQIADVLDSLRVHVAGGSRQVATDREIYLVEVLIAVGHLELWARDYFGRMEPAEQPGREEWLFVGRERRALRNEAHRRWYEWAEVHGDHFPIPDHFAEMFREAEASGA